MGLRLVVLAALAAAAAAATGAEAQAGDRPRTVWDALFNSEHPYNPHAKRPEPHALPATTYEPSPSERRKLMREARFVGEWLGQGADVPLPVTSGPPGRTAHDYEAPAPGAGGVDGQDEAAAAANGHVEGAGAGNVAERFAERRLRRPVHHTYSDVPPAVAAPHFHGADEGDVTDVRRFKIPLSLVRRTQQMDPLEQVFDRAHPPPLERSPGA